MELRAVSKIKGYLIIHKRLMSSLLSFIHVLIL